MFVYDTGMFEVAPGIAASPALPAALTALASASAAYCALPDFSTEGEQLGLELQALRHVIDELELAFAKQAGFFADTNQDGLAGSLGPAEWIRNNCRMSAAATSSSVCAGQRLARIPETEQALHAGEIGFPHLAMLASTERAVSVARGAPAFDERQLLQQAREHSVSRFRFDCASAREAADAAGFLTEHLTDMEWRSFELTPADRGVLIRGRLDLVGAAVVRTALESLAKRDGADDRRPRSQRMGDALVELANHGLDAGVLPSIAGQRPHLTVTTTLDKLAGTPGAPAAELEYAGPIPAATLQRLACDAEVSRVVFGPGSVLLDAGRARRVASPAMRRAMVARDQGCVWPGCERPPAWTAAHHLAHWTRDGGKTEVGNMASLCHRHHEKVHEHSYRLVRGDDGRFLALPPLPGAPKPWWPKAWTADDEAEGGSPSQRYWDMLHGRPEVAGDSPSP